MTTPALPFRQRAKKALVAGALAAGGALVTSLVTAWQTQELPTTAEAWSALVLAALGVGVAAGIATYKARNAGTINGSEPLAPPPAHRSL